MTDVGSNPSQVWIPIDGLEPRAIPTGMPQPGGQDMPAFNLPTITVMLEMPDAPVATGWVKAEGARVSGGEAASVNSASLDIAQSAPLKELEMLAVMRGPVDRACVMRAEPIQTTNSAGSAVPADAQKAGSGPGLVGAAALGAIAVQPPDLSKATAPSTASEVVPARMSATGREFQLEVRQETVLARPGPVAPDLRVPPPFLLGGADDEDEAAALSPKKSLLPRIFRRKSRAAARKKDAEKYWRVESIFSFSRWVRKKKR